MTNLVEYNTFPLLNKDPMRPGRQEQMKYNFGRGAYPRDMCSGITLQRRHTGSVFNLS